MQSYIQLEISDYHQSRFEWKGRSLAKAPQLPEHGFQMLIES